MNYWGRIFFIYENEKLTRIYGQPLKNHTDNCRAILERFREEYFHPGSKECLIKAVELHDLGKRETFRIYSEQESGKFAYSFAGHRFRVPHDDPYVAGLIRAHHEFSVEQINRERARLESRGDKETFADDLYLLCMADQLEAEVAVKAVEGKDDIRRTFMEFTTEKCSQRPYIYQVVPWPFTLKSFDVRLELLELLEERIEKKTPFEIQKILEKSEHFRHKTITMTLVEEGTDGH